MISKIEILWMKKILKKRHGTKISQNLLKKWIDRTQLDKRGPYSEVNVS